MPGPPRSTQRCRVIEMSVGDVGSRLVFVISPPRAGSTLFQRMLGAHPDVFTHPEPHLISQIAHLGVYGNVDKAPFDHINAAEAMKSFVSALPNQEQDYLDALRAYANTLYGRMLTPSGKKLFVDKTPANALVLPFLAKLYPDAKFIVLTRHPLAVFSSYANSFFNSDWQRAHDFNPILERYVPAIAKFLAADGIDRLHVRYEELVSEPEKTLSEVFSFLGVPQHTAAVEYGKAEEAKAGMGDPIHVDKHQRPIEEAYPKWVAELAHDKDKEALARAMISRLGDADLKAWNWPRNAVWAALEEAGGNPPPTPVFNGYTFQRRVMLALQKDIDKRPHGKFVRKLKYYCDVLLRE